MWDFIYRAVPHDHCDLAPCTINFGEGSRYFLILFYGALSPICDYSLAGGEAIDLSGAGAIISGGKVIASALAEGNVALF